MFKKRFILWAVISTVCLIFSTVSIIASSPILSKTTAEIFEYQPLLRVRAKSSDFGAILYISNDDYKIINSDMPEIIIFSDGQQYSGKAVITGKAFLPLSIGFTQGCFEGKCEIDGLDAKDGQQIECYVKIGPKLQCVGIPKSAVSSDTEGSYVYLIKDSMLQKKYISTDDNVVARLVSVTRGINVGDVVVVNAAAVEKIPKYMRRFASFD